MSANLLLLRFWPAGNFMFSRGLIGLHAVAVTLFFARFYVLLGVVHFQSVGIVTLCLRKKSPVSSEQCEVCARERRK